jgi:hypothetical protein
MNSEFTYSSKPCRLCAVQPTSHNGLIRHLRYQVQKAIFRNPASAHRLQRCRYRAPMAEQIISTGQDLADPNNSTEEECYHCY